MSGKRTISYVATLALLVAVGVAGWHAVEVMSSDAVGMAVGIIFGMLPGFVVGVLFCNWADRRTDRRRVQYRTGEVVNVLPTSTSLARRSGTEVVRW